MEKLSLVEPRFSRILCDVTLKVPELFLRTHKMIETVLLPEASLRTNGSVDLRRRKMLPRCALIQHARFVGKHAQQMHVIWHHDKVGQFIAVSVGILKTVTDNLR